jgi:hypothetical protein
VAWANQLFVALLTLQMAAMSQHPHLRFVDPARERFSFVRAESRRMLFAGGCILETKRASTGP